MKKLLLVLAAVGIPALAIAAWTPPNLISTVPTTSFPGSIELRNGGLSVPGGVTTLGGGYTKYGETITAAKTMTLQDCGKVFPVTAAIDTKLITLPEASTAIGCEYTFIYIGADGGALLDISPLDSDADGIEGGCTLAASVVTLSGTADADIGLTKASIQTGDYLTVVGVSATQWAKTGGQGICANN